MSTLKEVAKICGVTPATVSYILNGRHLDRMLPETIERVRAAAKKLNYRPHASARSLVTGRTETLGVYCPGNLDDVWEDSYLVDVLRGIFYESSQGNYAVQVASDDILARDACRRPAVDGWIAVLSRSVAPSLITESSKVVYLDPYKRLSGVVCLWGDNRKAGTLAGEFCRIKGWKTAFVLHEPLKESPVSYQQRWEGVRSAFQGAEKQLVSEPFVLPLTGGKEARKPEIYRHIENGAVDAVIATSDLLAHRILRDSQSLGFSIPADVRLIGIDNLLQSRLVFPAITTIDVAALKLGRQAAKYALGLLTGNEEEFAPPSPDLIERETT